MTEDPQTATDASELIAQLRDEMQAQYNELKASTEQVIEAQKAQIEKLEAEKAGLQAALVKSATAPAPEAPKEKTEEEIYREKVEALAQKGLADMKRRLTE